MVEIDGLNVENLKYVGEGSQGKVYLIDENRCLKLYKKIKYLPLELANLQRAEKESTLFPKVYSWGKDYMIREYIKGIRLDEYLKKHPLTETISYQLVGIIKDFKRLGFKRLDNRLNNIIITPKGKLRPIDPTGVMQYSQSYPKHMLSQLKKLGLRKRFLEQVKKIDKKLHKEWT